MGALGEVRAQQFKDRYEALQSSYISEDDPPPFHYGTHYSCAAYVLYYMMRLEPFSRLALALQGGKFDVADRLFHNIGSSWKSASQENLQDVRELIPEFFYLPDFLTNTNHFDFGTTQKSKHVHNVTLPKWAKGDPERFVRINRQALESDYVSKNLHLWIDLIFGYKQRGEEAVTSLNCFVHVTYEGEVDFESMTDVVQRESTIAQIQNFGQTPSRLERKPFQQRIVYTPLKENENSINYSSLSYMAPLTPPFCVVGTSHKCIVKRSTTEICKIGVYGQSDKAVGDMCFFKGQIIGVGRMCSLNIASKIYYRFGGPNNGISVHAASLTTRNRELNKMLTVHDGLHCDEISVAKASLNGQWLVTGSIDSTVRLWKYENPTMKLCATFVGHGGWKITCLDISTVFGIIVTGCAQGRVILWDLRTLTFVRRLRHVFKEENNRSDDGIQQTLGITSVSINHKNGNIITLVGPHVSVFDINGNLLGTENSLGARPSCAIATDCPEWQDQGIVVVTGHINGEVRFWSLNPSTREMIVRYLMVDREHVTEITALRATGNERQDTLLVGDKSGKMSICRTAQMENLSSKETADIITDLYESRRLTNPTQT
jgi:WD40 repeat protein